MNTYIDIGSAPLFENAVSIDDPNYEALAKRDCSRLITLIRNTVGPEPEGASLEIVKTKHGLDTIYSVHVKCDPSNDIATNYAIKVECCGPTNWD